MDVQRDAAEVAPGVFVTTSATDLTTSTILVNGGSALLVDPCWQPAELAGVVGWLADRNLQVVAGFATHAHHDHVLWHPAFGEVPRWASAVTAERAHRNRDRLIADLGPGWPTSLLELVGRLTPTDAATLDWPDRVELVRHDAHTPGHTALWIPRHTVLIAGDMLSDVEPPLPEETGPADYLAGLDILRPFVEQATLVIPGHGHPGPDVVHRWERDRALVSELR